jgi:uncharacterized membrane protein
MPPSSALPPAPLGDPLALPAKSRIVTVRNAFISGALLLAPLVVTVWAFFKIISLIGETFRPLFFFYLPERPSLDILLDVGTTVIVILLVTVLGYLSRDVFGRFFVSVAERFMHSIPGVGAVYVSVKQIVDTFSTQNRQLYNKVVLVEFPRKGVWAMGFLTNRSQGEAQRKTGAEVWSVFVPTTPNPTGGYLLLVPPADVVELEMSIGEGMKMIISGGAFIPQWPRPVAAAALPADPAKPAA